MKRETIRDPYGLGYIQGVKDNERRNRAVYFYRPDKGYMFRGPLADEPADDIEYARGYVAGFGDQ